jgi:7-carboxy-7-deazaguanine synthase
MTDEIRISEIFGPTIQGEGPLIGQPTIFVRTAGCDYRCSWCDTLYAVLPEYRDEWTFMSPAEILARVDALADSQPVLISISGGNPALQPLGSFLQLARKKGHSFALETQGSLKQSWFAELDWLVLSPKPPSSNMTADWSAVKACIGAAGKRTHRVLKIVIFDDADYAFAHDAAARFPNIPMYLQVGNPAPLQSKNLFEVDADFLAARLRWLAEKVTADRWFSAHVLPQLHVLMWGNKRGV